MLNIHSHFVKIDKPQNIVMILELDVFVYNNNKSCNHFDHKLNTIYINKCYSTIIIITNIDRNPKQKTKMN